MQEERVNKQERLKNTIVTWSFEYYISDSIDNNEALCNLEKGADRRNAVFGEHYHASCISNGLDQRQTGARDIAHGLVDVVQEEGSKKLAEHCSCEDRKTRDEQSHTFLVLSSIYDILFQRKTTK
jgi:hypothetical protein